jgi:hypothetical protein
MKNPIRAALLFVLLIPSFYHCGTRSGVGEPLGKENLAYRWAQVALQATAEDTRRFRPRPTVTSRYLALTMVSIFDAWSRYDSKSIPVYLEAVERRPVREHTLKNKEIAISYAAYRALREYYYSDTLIFRQFMEKLGLNPDNQSTDPATPEGIGNLAAQAVIDARRHDGSNQYGDEPGSDGTPYFDYTGYKPVNTVDKTTNVNRWQPKYFSDGKGGKFAPNCLTPHWPKVKPVALQSADQHRPPPPPYVGSEQLSREVQEVVDIQANLTNQEKALVEFMRDGPASVQQAGHWLKFAQDVSRRDKHSLDQDVKMYFAVEIAAMDGFIASWESKMFYDFARPYLLVHTQFKNQRIKAWGGPHKGVHETDAANWRPYSPDEFLCPPFPSYVSGHSTISGACAEILKRFTGSDTFGEKVVLMPGILTEPGITNDSVMLEFPTFTETANMAGISRVMGGYHIQADNIAGLTLGREVAASVWQFYNRHIGE